MEQKNAKVNPKSTEREVILINDDVPETSKKSATHVKEKNMEKASFKLKGSKNSEELTPVRVGTIKPILGREKFRFGYPFNISTNYTRLYTHAKKIFAPKKKKKITDFGDEVVMLTEITNVQSTAATSEAASETEVQASTSTFGKETVDYNVPDQSKGDFYCRLCDARTPTAAAFNCHVSGKKHLRLMGHAVINGSSGNLTTKKFIISDEPAKLMLQLQNIESPIIGLNCVCETRLQSSAVLYVCHLCNVGPTKSSKIIPHLTSTKHKYNYIKKFYPDQATVIADLDIDEVSRTPIIGECARELEDKYGQGKIEVKIENKSYAAASSSSEPICVDIDDEPMQSNDVLYTSGSSIESSPVKRPYCDSEYFKQIMLHNPLGDVSSRSKKSKYKKKKVQSKYNAFINPSARSSNTKPKSKTQPNQNVEVRVGRGNTSISKKLRWEKLKEKYNVLDDAPDQNITVRRGSRKREVDSFLNKRLDGASQGTNQPGGNSMFAEPSFSSGPPVLQQFPYAPPVPPQFPFDPPRGMSVMSQSSSSVAFGPSLLPFGSPVPLTYPVPCGPSVPPMPVPYFSPSPITFRNPLPQQTINLQHILEELDQLTSEERFQLMNILANNFKPNTAEEKQEITQIFVDLCKKLVEYTTSIITENLGYEYAKRIIGLDPRPSDPN